MEQTVENPTLSKILVKMIDCLNNQPMFKSKLLALFFKHNYRPIDEYSPFNEHIYDPEVVQVVINHSKDIREVDVAIIYDDNFKNEILEEASNHPDEDDIEEFLANLQGGI